MGLAPELVEVVRELGFSQMTEIQARALPELLRGRDLIGQSITGSGKTAAFSLPILQALLPTLTAGGGKARYRDLHALVLCPTRELCAQVAREIRRLGRRLSGLQVLVCSGGAPIRPQMVALERGVHIIVGTPGRLLDHLDRRSVDLRKLKTLVLDEADRMLDMGFEEDIQRILALMPTDRQTVFFSATFPRSIEAMSRNTQRDPVRVTVQARAGTDALGQSGQGQTAARIDEAYLRVEDSQKSSTLEALLTELQPESTLIFCNQKVTCAQLARSLLAAGLSAAAIHGDLEQVDRDRIMAKFRNRSTRILVATDVAARGIDVQDLDLVINYDAPQQTEVYVHRAGRTGRAGKSGIAITFVGARGNAFLGAVEREQGRTLREFHLNVAATPPHDADAAKRTSPHALATAAMVTLKISGGRKNKVRPGDILGALTGEAGGFLAAQIGKIEIHDFFAYVAVDQSIAREAVERLRVGKIKGRHFRVDLV